MASKQFSAVSLSELPLNLRTTSAIGFDGEERSVSTTSSILLLPDAEDSRPLGRESVRGGGGGGARIGGIFKGGFLGGVGRFNMSSCAGAGTGCGLLVS